MFSAKAALAVGLGAVCLSACGSTAKPEAGSASAITKNHKGVDDPRKKHIQCLQQEHIPVRRVFLDGLPGMQIDTRPSGPTVEFESTPGIAQGLAIKGQAQGAEAIGAALLYPNQATDNLLSKVETCVATGVSG
ncbi:MAG: hypothetical protein ACR2NR_02465 [Solirubrobacteraceae bacterium]